MNVLSCVHKDNNSLPLPRDAGLAPVKRLLRKHNLVNALRLRNEPGMGPLSSLSCKHKDITSLQLPEASRTRLLSMLCRKKVDFKMKQGPEHFGDQAVQPVLAQVDVLEPSAAGISPKSLLLPRRMPTRDTQLRLPARRLPEASSRSSFASRNILLCNSSSAVMEVSKSLRIAHPDKFSAPSKLFSLTLGV